MAPAVEVSISDEAYRKDPSSTAYPLLEILANTEGVLGPCPFYEA